jgi:zinc protease
MCACLVIGGTAWANNPPLNPTPKVHQRTLPNGHTLLVVEQHQAPKVTLDTWVATGSAHETPETNGLSHFLEHLLFKGTATWPTGAADRWLNAHGASYNAATSMDFTHYYLSVRKQDWPTALALHADMLQRATLPPAEVDKERPVVLEEMNRAATQTQHKLFEQLQRHVFAGHPYAQRTLGPRQVIETVPQQTIIDYWCERYQPQHLTTIVVGDITPDEAFAAVGKAFADAPSVCPTVASGKAVALPNATWPPAGHKAQTEPFVAIEGDPNITQAYVIVALPAPPANNASTTLALDAAHSALGGGSTSRLWQRLRNQANLVQSVSTGTLSQRYAGLQYLMIETSPDKLHPALKEAVQSWQTYQHQGPTADELALFKTETLHSFTYHAEQTEQVSQALGAAAVTSQVGDYLGYYDAVQALTLEQVSDALAKWGKWPQATLVAQVPADWLKKQPTLEADLKALLASKPQTDTTPKTPETPTAETTKPALVKQSLALPQGQQGTVWVQALPQATTLTVALQWAGGQRLGGMSAQWLASVLQTGPLWFKHQPMSEADWQRYLAEHGLKFSVAATTDALTLSVTAPAGEAAEALAVLTAVLQHSPVAEANRLTREKDQLRQSLLQQQDEPMQVAFQQATAALYGQHPYGLVGQAAQQALAKATPTDVATLWQCQQRQPLTVMAVGQVEPDALMAWAKALPSLAPQSPTEAKACRAWQTNAAQSPKPAPKGEVVQERRPKQAATWLVQAWPTPPPTDPTYPAFKVANALMGQGMSSRLFTELREKRGLAYAVGSLHRGYAQGGLWALYLGTDPANEAKVKATLADVVSTLVEGGVTAEEVADAKQQLMGQWVLGHDTPAARLGYWASYEAAGLGVAYDEQALAALEAVTLDDVREVFAKWLLLTPAVTSWVGPPLPANGAKP